MLITLLSCYKLNRCYIKLSLVNILEMVFVFIEILFKILPFKGAVLIYAEHCVCIYGGTLCAYGKRPIIILWQYNAQNTSVFPCPLLKWTCIEQGSHKLESDRPNHPRPEKNKTQKALTSVEHKCLVYHHIPTIYIYI